MIGHKIIKYFNQFLSLLKYLLVLLKKIFGWKFKGLSEEIMTAPATPDSGFAPRLSYINKAKI